MSSDGRPRKRTGLEGLPANDGEVFALDTVRAGSGRSDTRALIMLWAVGVVAAVLAIWGRSIILGVLTALALPLALWWTIVRWRSRSDARRTPQS
ncbi:MAG TPA: hypothetical protein VKH36_16045 [Acidimicrobiia bacterium]|nr:hypothetical protein [Acidimicrobiia bacterium]